MASDLLLQDGQTVVFIGDSITDCGRRGERAPYGDGYVKAAIDLLAARYPERRIAFHNKGIGGNTIEDLRGRWQDDVLALKPDWVSVKIGINDLHRTLNDPTLLPPARFETLYRQCLALTREKTGANLLLISPFYLSADTDPETPRGRVLARLPGYIDAVERLAEEFGARYVPLQTVFEEQLRHRSVDSLCPEPVHPYLSGHLVIAHAVLQALGW